MLVCAVVVWTALELVAFAIRPPVVTVVEEEPEAPAERHRRLPKPVGSAKFDAKGRCESKCTLKRECPHLYRVWGVLEKSPTQVRCAGPWLTGRRRPEAVLLNTAMLKPADRRRALLMEDEEDFPEDGPAENTGDNGEEEDDEEEKEGSGTAVSGPSRVSVRADRASGFPKSLDIPSDLVAELPDEDAPWRYGSCAVVGNSGLLKNGMLGAEIDAHDAVVRVNYAPVEGYGRQVGKRTTFDVVSTVHAKAFLPDAEGGEKAPGVRGARRNSTVLVYDIKEKFPRLNMYAMLLRRLSVTSGGAGVLSPGLVAHAYSLWSRLRQAAIAGDGTLKPRGPKPMAGFFAVIFAAQVCKEVHMYGFSPYQRYTTKFGKFHYMDKLDATISDHSFELANNMLGNLANWPCSDATLYMR